MHISGQWPLRVPSLTWLWLFIQRRCVHCRRGRGYVLGGRVRRGVRELRQKIWLEGALRLGLWRRGLELADAKITFFSISLPFCRKPPLFTDFDSHAFTSSFNCRVSHTQNFTWKRKLLQAVSILKESMTEMTLAWRHSKQLRLKYRSPFRSPWSEFFIKKKKRFPLICALRGESNPIPGAMMEYGLKNVFTDVTLIIYNT